MDNYAKGYDDGVKDTLVTIRTQLRLFGLEEEWVIQMKRYIEAWKNEQ